VTAARAGTTKPAKPDRPSALTPDPSPVRATAPLPERERGAAAKPKNDRNN